MIQSQCRHASAYQVADTLGEALDNLLHRGGIVRAVCKDLLSSISDRYSDLGGIDEQCRRKAAACA